MAGSVSSFLERLTDGHRLLILGGLAVIAYGRDRHTYDVDVWLEPLESPQAWAKVVVDACRFFPGVTMHRLPGWTELEHHEIPEAVEETGMVRLRGLSEPLDIFRRPNEFEEAAFEEVAARAEHNADGTLLPDPLDLLQSKLETNRDKDRDDMFHLENLTRARYAERLPGATLEEAAEMLDRFADWQVLRVALTHPDQAVQELARDQLKEFAEAGDPFSQALLEGRPIPGE